MSDHHMRTTTCRLIIGCFLVSVACAAGQPGLTLYLPFDGNLTPGGAAGKTQFRLSKPDAPVRYVEGVKGQAVVLTDNTHHSIRSCHADNPDEIIRPLRCLCRAGSGR